MCNDLWENSYPSAKVSFLPEGDYDHSPIIKFFNFWAGKDSFIYIVKETCQTPVPGVISYQIQQKLKLLKYKFKQHYQHT